MVHISHTSFFENFRNVMPVSPLQYTKAVKLHRAHIFIKEGKRADKAAYLVGQISPTQFSNKYKRHFGNAPSAM